MTDLNHQVDSDIPQGAGGGSGSGSNSASAGLSAGLNTLARGLTIFDRKQTSTSAAVQRDTQSQTLTASYLGRQQSLSDAVATGQISETEGAMQSRALLKTFSASNPSFATDLATVHQKFVEPSFGPAIQEADRDTKLLKEQFNAAVDANAVDMTQPEPVRQSQFRAWNAFNAAEKQLEFLNTSNKVEARAGFNYYTEQYLNVRSQSYATIIEQGLSPADTVAALEQQHIDNLEEVSRIGIQLDNPEDVEFVTSMLTRNFDIQTKIADGTFTREAAQNELNTIKALGVLDAVNSNPAMKKALVLSEMNLSGEAMLVAAPNIVKAIGDWFNTGSVDTQGGGGTQDFKDGPASQAHLSTIVLPTIAAWTAKLATPAATKQLTDQVVSALKGADLVRDAEAGRNFMSYMANPQLGRFLAESETIPQEFALTARDAIQGTYGADLKGVIEQEAVPLGISLEWDNGGIRFQTATPGDRGFRTMVRLNQKAAPLLNEYIRGMSHLNGHKNYRQWWEENATSVVPQQFTNIVKRQEIEADAFINALARAENASKAGFNQGTALWSPHKSLEGGTDTLAYGHKLTPDEDESGVVNIQGTPVAFGLGITEDQATALFEQDVEIARNGIRSNISDFDQLPEKYQDVLTNISFNAGPPTEEKWPKLLEAMRAGDDHLVRKEMVTVFKSKKSRKRLTSRAKSIADAVRLGP